MRKSKWLEDVYESFDFYLINNELYMEITERIGIGKVFRHFNVVAGCDFFDSMMKTEDLSEIACEYLNYKIIKLPKKFDLIKEHIFHLYNGKN